jgi:hypothetical protein
MENVPGVDVRLTLPREIAEAVRRRLEHVAIAYDEDGQAVGRFYDLLVVALAAPGGCRGCDKAKQAIAVLELERDLLETRVKSQSRIISGGQEL